VGGSYLVAHANDKDNYYYLTHLQSRCQALLPALSKS
jgi:hypothetical protein